MKRKRFRSHAPYYAAKQRCHITSSSVLHFTCFGKSTLYSLVAEKRPKINYQLTTYIGKNSDIKEILNPNEVFECEHRTLPAVIRVCELCVKSRTGRDFSQSVIQSFPHQASIAIFVSSPIVVTLCVCL
jgi:hypothetical protein